MLLQVCANSKQQIAAAPFFFQYRLLPATTSRVSSNVRNIVQSTFTREHYEEDFVLDLLQRQWALLQPDTKIHQISLYEKKGHQMDVPESMYAISSSTSPALSKGQLAENGMKSSFSVVRDDLLHPFVNGNKARKLDAVLPVLDALGVTDVVTCGGCQSAHTAAVAVSCAERGIHSHLLLRGERPEVSTGYNLISSMFGNVSYVPRHIYARREEMLSRHADIVAGTDGSVFWLSDVSGASGRNIDDCFISKSSKLQHTAQSRKVLIIKEGAGDAIGLLGMIRLVRFLSQANSFGQEHKVKLVVDSGTGTTAVGLALGVLLFRLPWEITGIMLADTVEGYKAQEKRLIFEFMSSYGMEVASPRLIDVNFSFVNWVERKSPRKFGNVLKGELEECQRIARGTGILVDPVYTLSAWEHATDLSQDPNCCSTQVVMLHTGGTLGMFGLAQRYKCYFNSLDKAEQ